MKYFALIMLALIIFFSLSSLLSANADYASEARSANADYASEARSANELTDCHCKPQCPCDPCPGNDCGEPEPDVECEADLTIDQTECGFKNSITARYWCELLADFWSVPYDATNCKVSIVPGSSPAEFCATYSQFYLRIIGTSKKDTFMKFYEVIGDRIYDGYWPVSMCIHFDEACRAT